MADSGFTYRIDPGPAKRGAKEVVKAFSDIEKATKRLNARTINNTQRFGQALNKLSTARGPTAATVRNTAKLAESLTNFRAPSPAQIRNMREFFFTLSRRSDNANVVRGLDRIATSSGRVAEQAGRAAKELRAMHQEASRAAQRGGRFSAAVGARATPAGGRRSPVEEARELARAQDTIGASYERAGKRAKKAARETGSLNTTVRELTSASVLAAGPLSQVGARVQAIGSIASRTGVPLAALIGTSVGLAAGFGALVTASSRAILRMEKYQAMLTSVTSSTDRTEQELTSLMITAKEFGLTFDSLAQQYARIRAAGESVNMTFSQTREIFDGFITATSALRLSAAETSGVFRALEQMISKGRVQAEELRGQLGERLPGAFGIAAQSMGVTTAELNKLLETGQVAAEDLLPQMSERLEEMFSERALENANSLQGSLNNLNNAFFELNLAFAEASNLEEILTNALQGTISVLESLTRNMDDIVDTAEVLAGVLGGALAGVAIRSVLIPAVGALAGALTNLRAVMTSIASLRFGATLAAIGGAAAPLGAIIGGAAIAFDLFASKADKISEIREEIEAVGDSIQGISSSAMRDPLRTVDSIGEAMERVQANMRTFSDRYSVVARQVEVLLEDIQVVSESLRNETGPIMPGADDRINKLLDSSERANEAAETRRKITEEQKEAQEELLKLERERQNLLASGMSETFGRAEILGIEGAAEALRQYGDEWDRILRARERGDIDAGFSPELQERLEETKNQIREMTTPLSNVKNLIDGMDSLADKIAPPQISEERQQLIEARDSIEQVSEAQTRSTEIAANLQRQIEGLTEDRKELKAIVESGNVSEEKAAVLRSRVSEITQILFRSELQRAQALDHESQLKEKAIALENALATARQRSREEIREQIQASDEYAKAARRGVEAVEELETQRETYKKIKEIQETMAEAFGESWTNSTKAVKLYGKWVATVTQDLESSRIVENLKELNEELEKGFSASLSGADSARAFEEARRDLRQWVADRRSQLNRDTENWEERARRIEEIERESLADINQAYEQWVIENDPIMNQMVDMWKNAVEQIQTAFSDMFFNILDGQVNSFRDFTDTILDTFKRMLAEMATLAIARPIIIPMMTSVGGAMGVPQNVMAQQFGLNIPSAGGQGGGFSLSSFTDFSSLGRIFQGEGGGIFPSAQSLANFAPSIFGSTGGAQGSAAAMSAISGSAGPNAFAQGTATALPYIGAALGAFGAYQSGSPGSGAIQGAMAGAAFGPPGILIGALGGGLLGALGGDSEPDDADFRIGVNQTEGLRGDFSSRDFGLNFRQDRGDFLNDQQATQSERFVADYVESRVGVLDEALQESFGKSFQDVIKGSKLVNVSDFAQDFLSEDGTIQEGAERMLGELMSALGGQFQGALPNSISRTMGGLFTSANENPQQVNSIIDAMSSLSSLGSLDQLNAIVSNQFQDPALLSQLRGDEAGTADSGLAMDRIQEFIQVKGAIEGFNDAQRSQAEVVEEARVKVSEWNDELDLTGKAAIDTKDEFSDYINSLDLTTEAGREAAESAMEHAGALDTVIKAEAQLKQTRREAALSLMTESRRETVEFNRASRELQSTFSELNMEVPRSSSGFIQLIRSLDLTTESGQETFNSLMSVQGAFEATIGAIENVRRSISEMFGSTAQNIRELTMGEEELYNFRRNRISELRRDLGEAETPQEVNRISSAIDEFVNQIISDTPGQIEGREQEWLNLINGIDAQAATILSDLKDEVTGADTNLEGAASSMNSSAEGMISAASTMQAAADQMNAAAANMNSAASSIPSNFNVTVTQQEREVGR